MITHTKLPWFVYNVSSENNKDSHIAITNQPSSDLKIGDRRAIIARIMNIVSKRPLDEEDRQNAMFIIKACNSYYEMKDALKIAEKALMFYTDSHCSEVAIKALKDIRNIE